MKRRSLVALAGGCTLIGACFSLDVVAIQPTTGTAYTREDVLRDPSLMELLVAGVFVNYWGGVQQDRPWTVFGVWGEELSTSVLVAGEGVFEHVVEPRPKYNNTLSDGNNLSRDPWAFFYEANAAAVEFPKIIKTNNIKVIDKATGADNTPRLLAFAKWIEGMSHVNLGLIFDSAAIVNEEVDLSRIPKLPLSPYPEVIDSGVKWLEEAIQIATDNTFIFPLNATLWVYNTGFTNEQMRAVSHSMIARALVYRARTPEERAAVDWALVKQHLALGLNAPFGPRGQPNAIISFLYRISTTSAPDNSTPVCNSGNNNACNRPGSFRVDTRLVGPGDTSGAYQTWLTKVRGERFDTVAPITIETPDQRIQAEGNTTPVFKPAYFKHTLLFPQQSAMDTTLRGKYYVSYYWNSTRAQDNRTQFPRDGGGRNLVNSANLTGIQDEMILPVEMDLLMAEAEIHTGNPAAAAVLINKSRVENGGLPPVTAAGVPVSGACVPRRYDGTCGTLMDAMMYEKRLETYGTAIAFYDARGWGCLLEGTPLHLPVPGRQLDLMGKPIYSFGGKPGDPGNAPRPTSCPLLHHP